MNSKNKKNLIFLNKKRDSINLAPIYPPTSCEMLRLSVKEKRGQTSSAAASSSDYGHFIPKCKKWGGGRNSESQQEGLPEGEIQE